LKNKEYKMSNTFVYDTGEIAKTPVPAVQKPKIFELIPEDYPFLRQAIPEFDFKNPPVDPNEFASALVETCKENKGLGLSANQCGFSHRVFVMGAGEEYVAFFNPVLLSAEGEEHMMEACLSFPLLGLRITRPKEITVGYQDFRGEYHTAKYVGMSARCFLHELDHMNGIVYTDVAKPLALKSGMDKRNKTIKNMARAQASYINMMKKSNVKNKN
jgi:peptide deformylase